MEQKSALGRVYLNNQSFESYLPEFVKQSDVFNKQVKNVLIKIADLETSQSLPSSAHDRLPNFSSGNEEIVFLRGLIERKNSELETNRNEISQLRSLRISDTNLIKQLQHRIKLFQHQIQQQMQKHRGEKEHLQQRIDRIEQQIDFFQNKKHEDKRVHQLQLQISMLKQQLLEDGKQMFSNGQMDSYKIQQLQRQLTQMRQLYSNLITHNNQLKLQLQIISKPQRQNQQPNEQIFQLSHKLLEKQNNIQTLSITIQNLQKQISILKINPPQLPKNQNMLSSYYQKDVEYLNNQIKQLRRQLQQIHKKQNQTYQQKINFQRQVFRLTNQLHNYMSLKGQLESRKFELELSQAQNTRLHSQITMLTSENSQILHQKQYFQQNFRRSDQQVQQLLIKIQQSERQIRNLNSLQDSVRNLGNELNDIHKKYLQSNGKQKQVTLKYQLLMKDNQNLRNLLNSQRVESQNYRLSFQKRIRDMQQAEEQILVQNREIQVQYKNISYQNQRLKSQLQYSENRLISFQQTLLEFQKAYKQNSIQLQQIRTSVVELQEFENVFLKKESRLFDIVNQNLRRLVRNKQGIRISDNYKLQKRINLFNQIIEIIESQNMEIAQVKETILNLEDKMQYISSQSERNRLQLNTLSFQKQHLINELDSMLNKLRYTQSTLEKQTRLVDTQNEQIEKIKRMQKNSSDRLSQQMQKRVWLQNQLNGAAGKDMQSLKAQRSQVIYKIKGILDN